jgi:hypothetical protein
MVQTFGTNAQNDIYLGRDGNLVVNTGLQAVLQACENASKAQLGEEVLTTKNGVPNFQTVWVGNTNFQLFRNYLTNILLGVPGVQEVESIQISPTGNTLIYTATIVTIYGTGEITNG